MSETPECPACHRDFLPYTPIGYEFPTGWVPMCKCGAEAAGASVIETPESPIIRRDPGPNAVKVKVDAPKFTVTLPESPKDALSGLPLHSVFKDESGQIIGVMYGNPNPGYLIDRLTKAEVWAENVEEKCIKAFMEMAPCWGDETPISIDDVRRYIENNT